MASQSLKKICNLMIIAASFTLMFSAQISHSKNVDMCIKHCVPNQCLKEVKNATPTMCDEACKKLCNEQYVVRGKSLFCQAFPSMCTN